MGRKQIKSEWKSKWSEDRPTVGYCYPVCEVVYYYTNKKTKPYILKNLDGTTHWFLKTSTGRVIDLTADQIDDEFDYNSGVKKSFMTSKISNRGKILLEILRLT